MRFCSDSRFLKKRRDSSRAESSVTVNFNIPRLSKDYSLLLKISLKDADISDDCFCFMQDNKDPKGGLVTAVGACCHGFGPDSSVQEKDMMRQKNKVFWCPLQKDIARYRIKRSQGRFDKVASFTKILTRIALQYLCSVYSTSAFFKFWLRAGTGKGSRSPNGTSFFVSLGQMGNLPGMHFGEPRKPFPYIRCYLRGSG